MSGTDSSPQPPPTFSSRRRFVRFTGVGLGLLLANSSGADTPRCETMPLLKKGDHISLDGQGEEIVRRAYELGHAYEKQHGGCARCTVAALQDAIPFVAVDESLFRGATCLDGGATPTDIQNCGAFTGAGMVIGYVCGSTRHDSFEGDATLAHQLLHRVYDHFKREYGTVLCKDVRNAAEKDCPKVVGRAAQWVAQVLLSEFSDYTPPAAPVEEAPAAEGG